MNDEQQQLPPIIDAEESLEGGQHLDTIFDDLESKQIDTLDEASKALIERIAIFIGVLFGVTVLNNTFPPPYLKGNIQAKVVITIALVCFLFSIAAAVWSLRVRTYQRYTYNITETDKELRRMLRHKQTWLHWANILIALAILLILIVWSL
jgi:hypothetical protein